MSYLTNNNHQKIKPMFNLHHPLQEAETHYRRVGGVVQNVTVPDILIPSNGEFIAITSSSIIYFSKDALSTRIYYSDRVIISDISIEKMWLSVLNFTFFKKLTDSIIINEDKIQTISRLGQKYVLLENGEELILEESNYSKLITGHSLV